MKFGHVILIVTGILMLGYIFYLYIGMTSTLPPLKEYKYGTSLAAFSSKLDIKVANRVGWSAHKSDSSVNNNVKVCESLTLLYNREGQSLEYRLRYCLNVDSSALNSQCMSVLVIGCFDYANKQGGYKRSDEGVDRMLQFLDRQILNELAGDCSSQK